MLKQILLFASLIVILFFSSCTENNNYNISINVNEYNIPDNVKIRNFSFLNDNIGILCAGTKNEKGVLYLTNDMGRTWTKTFQSDSLSVNNVFFFSDSIAFACGDSLMLLKSNNGGNNWIIIEPDTCPVVDYYMPYNEVYAFNEENVFLVGGEYFYNGIWTKTDTGNNPWIYDLYENELSSMCFLNEEIGFFGGYGLMFVTEDGGNTFDYIDFENDFFVDLETDESGNVYATSDCGILYKSSDLGYNWSREVDDYSAEFTDLFLGKETSVLCGWNGVVYLRTNETASWEELNDVPKVNYYCSFVNSANEIFLGSDNGTIYILNKKRSI